MIQSVLLSLLINHVCLPIEQQRAKLYLFYPEQTHGCQKTIIAVLHPTNIPQTLSGLEKQVTLTTEQFVRDNVPVYLYSPLIAGYAVLVEQRVSIPIGPVAFTLHTNSQPIIGLRFQLTW